MASRRRARPCNLDGSGIGTAAAAQDRTVAPPLRPLVPIGRDSSDAIAGFGRVVMARSGPAIPGGREVPLVEPLATVARSGPALPERGSSCRTASLRGHAEARGCGRASAHRATRCRARGLGFAECGSTPANPTSVCSSHLRKFAEPYSSLMSASATTAKAAAEATDGGYPLGTLPPSHFVARCKYRIVSGDTTDWFVDGSGRSTLAPPSLAVITP
jgi:hypothetical protein